MVQEQVFRLKVSVDDSQLVDILDARNYLLVHFAGFFFLEPSVLDDVLKQLTSRTVFHDQVEIIVVLNHLVQLHHVRVSHLFQNRYFSVYAVDVRLVFYFVLLENLYGDLVSSYDMRSLFNFAESTLTFCFSYYEASDLLSF